MPWIPRNTKPRPTVVPIIIVEGSVFPDAAVSPKRWYQLRYNITPEQSTEMFDMLDSQQQGKISKDDLDKHFVPLVQKLGCADPPGKSSKQRKASTKGVSDTKYLYRKPFRTAGTVVLLGGTVFRSFFLPAQIGNLPVVKLQ